MGKRPPKLIRPSERSDFLECEWKWYQSYILGRTTVRVPTWAWFGTAIHKAQEVRYPIGIKRGHPTDVLDAFEEAVGTERRRVWTQGGELDEEEVVDGLVLGKAMLAGYMRRYGADRHWQVIHSEQTFQVDVQHPLSATERIIAILCGTWDLVVWDRVDKVYRVVDHKTRKAFRQMWDFLDLNIQAGSYLWVAPEVLRHKGIFGPKDKLDGIVFNILKKHMPDDRPVNKAGESLNKDGSVSLRQPADLFYRHTSRRSPQERVTQAKHVVGEAHRMHLILTGKLPALKHPTEDCPNCPFWETCVLDESDPAAAEYMARTMYVTRDPYAAHREAFEDNGIHLPAKEIALANTQRQADTTPARKARTR